VKKVIGLPMLVLVLAALVALAPGAARALIGDAKGPSCRDITNGQFNYTGTGTNFDMPPYTLSGQLLLGDDGLAAPCKQVTYTLYVIVDGTDASTATAYPQDGNVQWLNLPIADDDPDICVFATTGNNAKAFDTAPDSGCLPLHAGTTGGGGGFN
jgi:hypothetical protein